MRAKVFPGAIVRGAILLRAVFLHVIFFGAAGLALLSPSTGAKAQFLLWGNPVWHGNDTGGIIPWSCENEVMAPRAAAGFCAQYNKYARITGVTRHYGDYISFNCLWAPDVERFARPAVATRTFCGAESQRLWTK